MLTYIGNGAEVVLPEVCKPAAALEVTGFYTLFKAVRRAGFVSPHECHSALEMVYVLEGTVGITANENIYTLPAGHISFHPSMEFHKLWSENNAPATVFIFSFDLTGQLTHKFKSGVFRLNDAEKRYLESIIEYLDSGEPPYSDVWEMDYRAFYATSPFVLDSAVKMLEAFMIRFATSHIHAPEPSNDSQYLYTRIVSIMEQSVYDHLSIAELAARCGSSPTTVKNTVKTHAGCSVHRFLLKIKMRKAIELLTKGKNVSEVSDILGFCNPNYFSQVFYRETGRHAGEYK